MVTKEDNKLIIDRIEESSLIDSAAEQWDSFQQQKEDEEADKQGLCPHCYQPKKNCTGYKCWK